MRSLKNLTILLFVIFLTVVSLRFSFVTLEMVGESIGYDYCVACGHNCFLRGEHLVDFKIKSTLPFTSIQTEYFPLCSHCYKHSENINRNYLIINLIYNRWDKKDILLIIDRIKKIKKERNHLRLLV